MRAVAPLTGVIERVYAPEPDTERWLEGIRAAFEHAFSGHVGAQTYVMRLTATNACIEAVAAADAYRSTLVESHSSPDPASYQEFVRAFVRQPVLHREFFAKRPALTRGQALIRETTEQMGLTDIVATWGFATPADVCALSFCVADERWRMTRPARASITRLRAHLAASWRLRLRATEASDAVLTPSGVVLDAEGRAKERGSRERLREAALGITRAKRESAADPAAGLTFWRAMVDGRWTLVERVDTDGKRLLFAKRNAPEAVSHTALTPKERAVVERAALGGSLRHVAYELGLPESTASEVLSRAMKKLGLRSRAELVELFAALSEETCVPPAR